MKYSKLIFTLTNIVLVVALAVWALHHISLSDMLSSFAALPKDVLLYVFALNILVMLIYGTRVQVLADSRFTPALQTAWLGFGLNGIFPMRLGDLARIFYARRLLGASASRVTAIFAMEKIFDLAAIVVLGLIVMQFIAFKGVNSGVKVLIAVLMVAILGLLILHRVIPGKAVSKHPVAVWLWEVTQSIKKKITRETLLKSGVLTLLIWGTTIATTFVMFAAIHPGFSWLDACLLTLILVLAIAIPGAPAGLGLVEAAIVGYLHSATNLNMANAIAAAFAFHLISAIPQIAGAIVLIGMLQLRSKGKTAIKS